MLRCFVALDVPAETSAALAAVQSEMMALESPGAVIKPSAVENLHLTLKFLGATADAQLADVRAALQCVAKAHSPIEAHVEGIGAFPHAQQPRSIHGALPLHTEGIVRIMEAMSDVCADLGFAREQQPRLPHVTLARLRRVDPHGRLCDWLHAQRVLNYGPLIGDAFTLYASTLRPQGSLYEPLARFRLSG